MNTILTILTIIYGLTSLLILLVGLAFAKNTNLDKDNSVIKMNKIYAWLVCIIWCILPLLRWLFIVGTYRNYQESQLEKFIQSRINGAS